jgi:hypothetical protein
MITGVGIFGIGLLLYLGGRIPWLGNLPGNIVVQREHVTVFIPVGTMILVSVVLTVVLNLVARLFR